jgi:transcriptional regulator with XRE-family HTH domain
MSFLGERLRQAREARGIALLQAEMDTRIRATVIEALEQGDYENLPPEPFLRGLIRTYAAYLGLDSEEMLALHHADRIPPPPFRPTRAAPTTKTPVAQPAAPASASQTADVPTAPPSRAKPEEPVAPMTPLPPAEPVRKPAAIRLPSLRPPISRPPSLKPSIPEPPTSPESLTPPEPLTVATSPTTSTSTEPVSRVHATRRPMPLLAIAALFAGVICLCLASALLIFTQFSPMFIQLTGLSSGTSTRLLPTRTPTLRPGAFPTAIPTLAATAPPYPSLAGIPTTAPRTAPRSTLETFSGLQLDVVQVTETITLHVGIDGRLVFSGPLQPGATRSWSAKDLLYVEIENPKGATLEMNGNAKWFAPRNFAETRSLERQWTINDKGTPVPVTPAAPATPLPRAPNPASPFPSDARGAPTPTLTPFS